MTLMTLRLFDVAPDGDARPGGTMFAVIGCQPLPDQGSLPEGGVIATFQSRGAKRDDDDLAELGIPGEAGRRAIRAALRHILGEQAETLERWFEEPGVAIWRDRDRAMDRLMSAVPATPYANPDD